MSTIRPTWLVRRTKVVAICRAAFHQHSRTDIRGCNDNVVAQNQEFRLSPSRLHTGSTVVRRLLGRPRRLSGHGRSRRHSQFYVRSLSSNHVRRGARKALPHSDPEPHGPEALSSTPRAVQGIPVDQTTGQRAPLLARFCAACRVLAGKRESSACRCPV
jgi:hypothetical protein